MDKIRVFVSFDLEHDADLYAQMLGEAAHPNSGFEVSGHSKLRALDDYASEAARRGIQEADQVLFICGEHTEGVFSMGQELLMAREEETPYVLVWGRREIMCTKPMGARPAEGMYSWTSEILRTQMATMQRAAVRAAKAEGPRAHGATGSPKALPVAPGKD